MKCKLTQNALMDSRLTRTEMVVLVAIVQFGGGSVPSQCYIKDVLKAGRTQVCYAYKALIENGYLERKGTKFYLAGTGK